jgi:hypothetical protein
MSKYFCVGARVTAGVGDGTVEERVNDLCLAIRWDCGELGYVHPDDIRELYPHDSAVK